MFLAKLIPTKAQLLNIHTTKQHITREITFSLKIQHGTE